MGIIGIGIGLGTGKRSRSWLLRNNDSYISPAVSGAWGFKTNSSKTFSSADTQAQAKLSIRDVRIHESLSMTLTVAGVVVRSM